MPRSPYVTIARRLMSAPSKPWEQPSRCREVAAGLRADGAADLADQLEQASRKPSPWLGASARA